MTRRSIVLASAAFAILLLTSPYVDAKSATAERTVSDADATVTERLQAVKDKLMNTDTANYAASSTSGSSITDKLVNIKDSVLGAAFDTNAARDTLMNKLQPTLLEKVRQKVTGHPTTAERMQGAIDDVASQYGVDSSTLTSYATRWGLTADNLNAKSDEVRQALLAKTEPTMIEKIRQKLTGHPTSTERITGAINDVAKEYGVDAQSLTDSASKWGLSAENLSGKAQDIKDSLLSKTEPTLVEKLRYSLTGHPTNAERAQGALGDLAKQYGVHPDNLKSLAAQHNIELPSSASEAADVASDKTAGLWTSLKDKFAGTKVEQLLSSMSPEEREARLHKQRVATEAHDALDEALEKLMSAHPNQKVDKVDVKLDERTKSLGERLSGYASSFGSSSTDPSYTQQMKNAAASAQDKLSGATQPSTTDKLSGLLSSYKDRIMSGSFTKAQLEESVGAEPTLMEKIQRAMTGHPTDAERAQGAASNAVDTTGLRSYLSSYYDSVKGATQPSTTDKISDTLSSYKDRILSGKLTKAQLEAAVGAEPTMLEKIQRAVTGHPTDAERAQGAASNAVDASGLRSYIGSYYDSVVSGASDLKAKAQNLAGQAQEVAEPTLMEKIQQKLTGHPTDAERAQGAASNLADKYGVKEQAQAAAEKAREAAAEGMNKAGAAYDSAKAQAEPTLMEKVQQKLTGHPTDAERAQGAAKNLADKYNIQGKAADAKDTVMEKLGVHEPTLTDRIKSSLGFKEPTLSEKLTAAAADLQARAKETLTTEPSTSEKLSAAATDLQAKAKEALGFHEETYAEKLQHYVADLQLKAKHALSRNEPTTAERLQAAADQLSGKVKSAVGVSEPSLTDKLSAKATDAKAKLTGATEPTLSEKVKGYFSGSSGEKVTVDKAALEEAEAQVKEAQAKVKAAKKTAKKV